MQRHYVMVSAKIDDAPIPIGVTNHLLPNDENDSVHSMDASYSFLSPALKNANGWLPRCARSLSFIWMKLANVILRRKLDTSIYKNSAKLCTK